MQDLAEFFVNQGRGLVCGPLRIAIFIGVLSSVVRADIVPPGVYPYDSSYSDINAPVAGFNGANFFTPGVGVPIDTLSVSLSLGLFSQQYLNTPRPRGFRHQLDEYSCPRCASRTTIWLRRFLCRRPAALRPVEWLGDNVRRGHGRSRTVRLRIALGDGSDGCLGDSSQNLPRAALVHVGVRRRQTPSGHRRKFGVTTGPSCHRATRGKSVYEKHFG